MKEIKKWDAGGASSAMGGAVIKANNEVGL